MIAISITGIIVIYFMINSCCMHNSPPVPSSGKTKTAMIEDVTHLLNKKKNQVVMDLGSGWGTLLLPLAKKFPQHHFIGVEYGLLPYLVSKLRSRNLQNLTFYHQNFFNTDISKADVILMFLLSHVMPKISTKCQSEAKEGALLYANRFPIPNIKATHKISLGSKYDTYYIYKIHRT